MRNFWTDIRMDLGEYHQYSNANQKKLYPNQKPFPRNQIYK